MTVSTVPKAKSLRGLQDFTQNITSQHLHGGCIIRASQHSRPPAAEARLPASLPVSPTSWREAFLLVFSVRKGETPLILPLLLYHSVHSVVDSLITEHVPLMSLSQYMMLRTPR